MKKYKLLLIVGLVLLLIGCSRDVQIYGDLVESKIVINEEHEAITFHTLIKNDGSMSTDSLFMKLIINDEQLAQALGNDEIIFADEENHPTSFTIDKRNGYFITLTYYYNDQIPLEQLVDAVTVIVFDEEGNEVTHFTIKHVINEDA